MNIRSVSNFVYKNASASNLKRRLFDLIPNMTIKNEEFACKIGRIISRPDVGRAIMGATALCTQPFIDYYNPDVDRDTAKVSTARTLGKIIAGTAVGIGVRSLCYYGTQFFTSLKPNAPWWRKLLLPSESVVRYMNRKSTDWVKNYNSALASMIGVGLFLFTNVLLDVPLTNVISKKAMKAFGVNHNQQPKKDDAKPREIKPAEEKILEAFANRNKWRADL
jgi:hypothetical protein